VAAPGALTLGAACSSTVGVVQWTVTNPASNPTVNTLAASNGATLGATTLAPGASTTFTTPAPQNTAVSVTGKTTPGNQNVSSIGLSFPGDCQGPPPPPNETPASVAFSSTCAGIHGVFTTASLHTTVFTVTTPAGATDTVTGSGTRDYPADATNSHLSVTFDGASQTADWVDPGGCTQPGQADPAASADNHCKTGINVVLSNVNGTADTVFTVTAPDGSSTQVPVRAGQMVKEAFAVTEDTAGVVTVSAPGLAKQTFTYNKNCAKVLGVKHVRKPPVKKPVVVKAEHGTLPFTGFDTQRMLLDGAALFFFGAMLCVFAARREEPVTED
jgi:hypothetical protein